VCGRPDQVAYAIATFRRTAAAAIDRIPEQIDLATAMTGGRRTRVLELDQVRGRMGDLRTYRWIGLGVLIVCLAVIATINRRPLSRLLVATGLVLALAAGAYLVLVHGVASDMARDEATRVLGELHERRWAQGSVEELTASSSERFALELLERSTGHASGIVSIIGVVGLGLLAGGIVTRR